MVGIQPQCSLIRGTENGPLGVISELHEIVLHIISFHKN